MKTHHIGIYVSQLEEVKDFFTKYFGFIPGEKYHNPQKGFQSYLLTSAEGDSRIEIMSRTDIYGNTDATTYTGFHHISFAAGTEKSVDDFARRLAAEGYEVLDGPRKTGDGYYECCIRGIEGILIEICSE